MTVWRILLQVYCYPEAGNENDFFSLWRKKIKPFFMVEKNIKKAKELLPRY